MNTMELRDLKLDQTQSWALFAGRASVDVTVQTDPVAMERAAAALSPGIGDTHARVMRDIMNMILKIPGIRALVEINGTTIRMQRMPKISCEMLGMMMHARRTLGRIGITEITFNDAPPSEEQPAAGSDSVLDVHTFFGI